ncbi:MAG: alpha/beta hydrolase [Pseudonocardiaceae bacterium]
MAAAVTDSPPYLQPFVLDVPRVDRERQGNLDVYRPVKISDGAGCPVVILVHGGPVPAELRPTPRDWPGFIGYASAVTQHGSVAVLVDHRLHDIAAYPIAAADVRTAVRRARALEGVNAQRVGLWFFSGGGLLVTDWLADPPSWLRCVSLTYPLLAPLSGWGVPGGFEPIQALPGADGLPLLLTRVGREQPLIADTVAAFIAAAQAQHTSLEIIDVANGQHGFDTLDHTDEARRAVWQALSWVTSALQPTL